MNINVVNANCNDHFHTYMYVWNLWNVLTIATFLIEQYFSHYVLTLFGDVGKYQIAYTSIYVPNVTNSSTSDIFYVWLNISKRTYQPFISHCLFERDFNSQKKIDDYDILEVILYFMISSWSCKVHSNFVVRYFLETKDVNIYVTWRTHRKSI